MESQDLLFNNLASGKKNELNINPLSINSSNETTSTNHSCIEETNNFLLHESTACKSNLVEQFDINKISLGNNDSNINDPSNQCVDITPSFDVDTNGDCKGEQNIYKEKNTNIEVAKVEIKQEMETKEEKEFAPKTEDQDDGWMDILGSGSLKKKVIKPGIPDTRPQKSDLCILNYVCELEDGSVVETIENIKINMGDYEINQGIDFALALMDKGEEAYIHISSRFGFGNSGKPPFIPPKATLLYKVNLLDVQKEEIQELKLSSRVQIGLKKKERGNFWHQRGDHTCAIHCYRRALDYFDDTEIPGKYSEAELHAMLEERLKVYNNLAASQTVIGAFDAALISVNNVLSCQPKNIKALFRKSKVLRERGEIEECIKILRQGLEVDPDSPSFKKELSDVLGVQRAQRNRQKELYKKMMGAPTRVVKKESDKKQVNNTLKWITIASFTVAVLGALVVKYRY